VAQKISSEIWRFQRYRLKPWVCIKQRRQRASSLTYERNQTCIYRRVLLR